MTTQVCFVNTDQPPTKIVRLGIFDKQQFSMNSNDIVFYELCEIFYPHPDAPNDAVVSLYQWLRVSHTPGTKQTIAFTIEAMKGLQEITEIQTHMGCKNIVKGK